MVTPDQLALTLPLPPSINHQYATVQGRRVLSAVGRSYKATVGRQIIVALSNSPHRHGLLTTLRTQTLSLSIRFHFASPLRRDLDGGLKITQDAITEALGINDRQIVELHLYKAGKTAQPRIEALLCPAPHMAVARLRLR